MKKILRLLNIVLPVFILSACGGGDGTTPSQTNSAPSIDTSFTDIVLQENNGTTNYALNISDVDGDTLTLSIESNDTSILSITPNFTNPLAQGDYSGVTLDFNVTTETNATGVVRVTMTLGDAEANTTTSFDVNVTDVFQSGWTWKGLVYHTVTSPHTGRVWLDRNLGASQACTALDDTLCYGDYYQWGRNADGHEKSSSSTTATQATDINNSGSSFITADGTYSYDWAQAADSNGSLRSAQWSKTDGTSVCPVGYRVPTDPELTADSADITNSTDAFNSFLKLPSAGVRNGTSGSVGLPGSEGDVWSSSASGSNSTVMTFDPGGGDIYGNFRAYGQSVRCIKD